jgi:OOP family OmpA-OmpF porin
VYFGSNSAVILPASLPLMDALAKLLIEHPELKLVVVEGHSDDRGSRAYNLSLSKGRSARAACHRRPPHATQTWGRAAGGAG